jgi:hypothetical protein
MVGAFLGHPTRLHLGTTGLIADRGVPQGDPLSPLLFALALAPAAATAELRTRARLAGIGQPPPVVFWYLDDCVAFGSAAAIAVLHEELTAALAAIGLEPKAPNFAPPYVLGVPMPGHADSKKVPAMLQDLAKLRVLGELDPQVALTLVRLSLGSFPRASYLARTLPTTAREVDFDAVDAATLEAVRETLVLDIGPAGLQQIPLPIAEGGLGTRMVGPVRHALRQDFEAAHGQWIVWAWSRVRAAHGEPSAAVPDPSPEPAPHEVPPDSSALLAAERLRAEQWRESLGVDTPARRHAEDIRCWEAGAWLQAVPTYTGETIIGAETFRRATGARLVDASALPEAGDATCCTQCRRPGEDPQRVARAGVLPQPWSTHLLPTRRHQPPLRRPPRSRRVPPHLGTHTLRHRRDARVLRQHHRRRQPPVRPRHW